MNRAAGIAWLRSLQQRSMASSSVRLLAPLTGLRARHHWAERLAWWMPRVELGLPPGLDDRTVRRLCDDLGVDEVSETWFVALNGWRATAWTTRLFLQDRAGAVTSVVCKATDYERQLPGARGLPLQPGPPEVVVLDPEVRSQAGVLAGFLPVSHVSRSLGPGRHLLVLEDLGATHRIRYDPAAVVRVVQQLGPLHAALAAWAGAAPWLDYEAAFGSAAFRDYVAQHVGSHATRSDSERARHVLEHLDDLVGRCTWPTWPTGARTLVHGDANVANVLHPRRGDAGRGPGGRSDIRFIDWEWAGHNLPHADLAALTKDLRPDTEAEAVAAFAAADQRWSREQHWTLYNQAKLARGLLDASFLSAQHDDVRSGARLDIEGPLGRVLDAGTELRGATPLGPRSVS